MIWVTFEFWVFNALSDLTDATNKETYQDAIAAKFKEGLEEFSYTVQEVEVRLEDHEETRNIGYHRRRTERRSLGHQKSNRRELNEGKRIN